MNPSFETLVSKYDYMQQFGDRVGTTPTSKAANPAQLFSQQRSGDQILTVVTQAATVSNYKQFETYSSADWYAFIKSHREEDHRLPAISRRPLKELIAPTVITQLQEDYDIDSWDTVNDAQILAMNFERFGPKSAREAKKRLEEVPLWPSAISPPLDPDLELDLDFVIYLENEPTFTRAPRTLKRPRASDVRASCPHPRPTDAPRHTWTSSPCRNGITCNPNGWLATWPSTILSAVG